MNRIIILFITFSILYLPIYTQTLPFQHYDSKDGLSSSNVFSMIQDKTGYIWFATKAGVSKFDSHSFENYNTNNGLASNDIINVALGSDSTIYFVSSDKGIYVFKNGKIEKYKIDNTENASPYSIAMKNDTMYTYSFNYLYSIYNHNLIKLYGLQYSLHGIFPDNLLLHSLSNTSLGIIGTTSEGLYALRNTKFEKIVSDRLEVKDIYSVCEDKSSNLWFCTNSKIYCVKNGKIINTINLPLPDGYNASNIYFDNYGRIWLAFLNKGFYFFENNKLINIGKKTGIERYPVSSIKEDRERNVWVTTLGTGVFCFHHMYVSTITETDGLSSNSIKEINMDSKDRIFAGTLDGLNIIDNDTIINFRTGFENDLYTYIFEIKPFGNYVYLGGRFKDPISFKSLDNNGINIVSHVVSSIEVKDKYLITGGWGNYIKIYYRFDNFSTVKKIFLEGDTIQNVRVNKILLDKNGSIWVGTSNGVFILDSNFNSKRFYKKELNSLSVSDIGQDKKDNLWFICNNGVYFYQVENDSIMEFTNVMGNDFIAATSVAIDPKNRIWVGCSKGINRIEYDDDNISVVHFDRNIGLPSNEVTSLFIDSIHHYLWAGTSDGLSKIDLTELDKEKFPVSPVVIEEISINDSSISDLHNISMDQKSHVNLVFSALSYSNSEAVEYEYKFEDKPGDWEKTKEHRLYFSSLKPGGYKLLIRANFGNGSITEPSVVEFNVKPNFYQTLYFYISAIFAGSIFISLIIYQRVKVHYKREGERAGYRAVISELKQQSLASMMNPHFIFNSLNSIQSFINKYEKDSANEYLAKFARLIRLNLNEADKTFILLNDEIERLKLYLELEKLRFGERLKYEIFIAPDIDPAKTLIPNMIIQPFVENSIIHGIIPAGLNGMININIFHVLMPEQLKENFVAIYNQSLHSSVEEIKSNPYYCIKLVVEDNGIGINAAQNHNRSKHISRGLQIIRERLSILHHYSGKDELVTISDKQEIGEKTSGTRVEIILSPNIYSIQSD